jgi:hypothetical protein
LSKGNSGENSPNNGTNRNIGLGSGNNGGNKDSEWHTGRINGNTFRNKEVKYRIINGVAIFEGDIILARNPQEIEKLSPEPKVPGENQPTVKPIVRAIVRTGDEYRWPRGEIPYTIQSTLPNQQRVRDAIRHWEERTPIRFIWRTNTNAQYYPNYVSFIQYVLGQNENPEEVYHCTSPVGMLGGGEQNIILSDQCTTGAAIHEIGHTVGLWHEQSREDRDDFIRIVWDNIDPNMIHNFSQHIVDGDDIGEYDYCSIMHYDVMAFSKNRQPTIEARQQHPCGAPNRLGITDVLSDGDIAAATEIYANLTPTVARNADGRLEIFTIRSDRKLYRKQQKSANSNEWEPSNTKQENQEIQNWSSLGLEEQFFPSGQRPAIVRSSDGRLDIFWLRDYTQYHAYQDKPNTKWSETLSNEYGGGDFDGDPVVAQNADGRLEIFMVHEEGNSNNFRLHHATRDGGALTSLGGRWSPNARPVIAINLDRRLEAFMVGPGGPDRQLYHRWQLRANDNTWSEDWSSLGDPFLGDPAADIDVNGRLHVFVVNGNNRQLEYRWQTTPGDSMNWSNWDTLEGHWSPRRRPAIAHTGDRMEVFMVGTDERLYHRWQTT